MSKIVYLLGAGASCKCLPTVAQIKDRIPILIESLKNDKYLLNDQHPLIEGKINSEVIDRFIDDLAWMNDLNSNHYSIDTVAKKFSLTNDERNYKRLKLIISNYFLIEQKLNKPDDRYDFFFASILSDGIQLPKDIKILSWNYDNQFELSFSEYCHDKTTNTARHILQVHEKFYRGIHQVDDPFIYRINGSLGQFSRDGNYNSFLDMFQSSERDFIRRIVVNHFTSLSSNNFYSGLSYSWERPGITSDSIEKIMKNCQVLVTIGYSFPFFNREIDRKILSSPNLEKIYIQNPNSEEIEEKIKGIHLFSSNTQFIPNKSTSEFLIPFEF
jgi:hypothetical protein